MKLLLVDDSKAIRLANQNALEEAGHEVICAEDGEAALRAAVKEPFDLILLDLMLPKVSGIDVLKRLKSQTTTANIPVVVLSGLSEKNRDKLIEAGADGYLEKSTLMPQYGVNLLPQKLEELVDRINRQRNSALASVPTSHRER